MRLGVVILPEHPWSEAQAIWSRAEELGFDHAWTYDHLAWRSLRDAPWFGTVPTLAGAALATRHIRLGTLVASPTFRHPVPLARELITLDDMSAGRLTLGIGAGSDGWDAMMLGLPVWSRRERADRFVEFVELLDRLLREPEVSYQGRYYSAGEARTYPGCTQRPRCPLVVAATGPRGMDLAVRFGSSWVTAGDRERPGPDDAHQGSAVVRRQMDRLDAACAAAGRDPTTLGRMVVTGPRLASGLDSVEAFRDTVGRYDEVGVTDLVVHWPRPTPPFVVDPAVFEEAIVTVSSGNSQGNA